MTFVKVKELWLSHNFSNNHIYGHPKSKTWHFKKVNTRQQRNRVMSIVESKESLQKAWEGLQWQWQCLEKKTIPALKHQTLLFFGKNWSSMRQINPFYGFSILVWLWSRICLSMRQFPGVALKALLQRSRLNWGCRCWPVVESVGPMLAAFGLAPLILVLLLQGWTLTFNNGMFWGENFP